MCKCYVFDNITAVIKCNRIRVRGVFASFKILRVEGPTDVGNTGEREDEVAKLAMLKMKRISLGKQ